MKYFLITSLFFLCTCASKNNEMSDSRMAKEGGAMSGAMPTEEVSKPTESKKSKTWKRSNKDVNIPTIFIGDKDQLPLKGSQISVKIDGFRARVIIDAFFLSEANRQLEGTFKMRLPQGASPYYLAFGESVFLDKKKDGENIPFLKEGEDGSDIEKSRNGSWKAPKVARVVPKEKAAFAYGQTVRRRIDPALAEWAGADVFNFRIFPILPKKLHRVVIGYDVNLTAIKSDWIYNFPIPIKDSPMVVDFDIAKIGGSTLEIEPKQESETKNDRVKFRLDNPAQGEINVRYRDLKNFAIQHDEVGKYFGLTLTPKIPTTKSSSFGENAIIALDTSLSSSPDKFNIWIKLVSAILLNNADSIKKFNVILFNIESSWWKDGFIENSPENVQAFLAYANTLALEGATDLNHLFSTISNTPWAKKSADNIFLLSDGADTWGEDDPYEMVKNITFTKPGLQKVRRQPALEGPSETKDRLFAFNTGMSGTAVDKLNQFTRASGGAVFAVNGEDEIKSASVAFKKKVWNIDGMSVEGGEDLLVAGRPKHLFEGQKLMVSGRGMLGKAAKVTLLLSQGDVKKEVAIKVSNILDSTLSKRVYGQMATSMLEEFGYTTEQKSIAYARHFQVPGKTCSLLMLENEEEYARFKISLKEDDALVSAAPVNQILEAVLKNIAENLGNAKNKFAAWLDKLTKTSGLTFTQSADLNQLISKTPETKFVVTQAPLKMGSKSSTDHSTSFVKVLSAPQLDYDEIVNESKRRREKYSKTDALKVLSSLVEKSPGNTTLARDVAYSAQEWGFNEQAYFLFRRILKQRPHEPQTYLAIAKALEHSKNEELAMIYYEIVLNTKWDSRFGAFTRIASLDYLHFLALVKKNPDFLHADFAQTRYTALRKELKQDNADLMIVISWNTDNTDIDLHVSEPTGEECFYSNRSTKIGGQMTQDVTTGYGPEMYVLKKAKNGKYNVRVKYFSSNRSRTSTRTKVYATIYRNWGTPEERVSTKVVSLEDNKEMHDIISLVVDE